MRRTVLLLTVVAATLILASGVALAVTKIGTDGPDTLRGTDRDDNLWGKGGDDAIFDMAGRDNLLGGSGDDGVLGGNEVRPEGADKNLDGGPGNDGIVPGVSSDNASGEEGGDFFSEPSFRESSEDIYFGGDDNDVFVANNRPASEDKVTCGDGFDWVLADREDFVAPDCERVSFGLSDEEFFDTVPQSFWEGLAPFPEG